MKKTRTFLRGLGPIAVLALGCAAAGCYSRTIEAKGIGTKYGERQIYEPNLKLKDPNAPKKESKGGFFSGLGKFFFGSDDEDE